VSDSAPAPASPPGLRTVLRHGTVYSPAHPHATALCVEGDRVVWVGDDDGAEHYLDGADGVVDLEGGLVTPAFVDAHAHLAQTGQAMDSLDLSEAHTLDEALDAVAAFARRRPAGLLLAFGWDDTRWPEQRPFTREEVDRAVGDRPAYLARVDVHSAVLSSALVRRMPHVRGLDGWSDDGWVQRGAHHRARAAVQTLVGPEERRDAIATALAAAAAAGIGAVHEIGAPHLSLPDDFAVLHEMADRPHVLGYWGELAPGGVETAARLGCVGAAGDLCVDGALGSHTAALRAPYADADTRGSRYLDEAQVRDHVVACTRAGLQAGFHCIGDDAAATVMAGFRAAADVVGTEAMLGARHRVEHVEMVSQDDVDTMARLGVVASVQPMFDRWWGGPDGLYRRRLGSRAQGMNPYATLSRAGVVLAFGSDSPVTPFDPWGTVRAAAFHHDAEERLTARAAFAAHTRGGWRAARRDDAGVLAPGAPADLAVWDVRSDYAVQTPDPRVAAWSTDPRAGVPVLPALDLDRDLPRCRRTYVDGRVVFDQERVAV
jgi:predicted amidohydrolase YtcJ